MNKEPKFEKKEEKTEEKPQKVPKKSEKELIKEEIKCKNKELEDNLKRLNNIPDDIKKNKELYEDGIEIHEIDKGLLVEQDNDKTVPLNPMYNVELTGAWRDLRHRQLKLKIKMKDREIESLRVQMKNVLKELSVQESRIKEKNIRLQNRLKELKSQLKDS